MKKLFALLLAFLLLVGCSGNPYENAVAKLEKSGVALDVDSKVYKNILTALENEEFVAPKNIILMIGDGMGFNSCYYATAAAEDELYKGELMMSRLPVHGQSETSDFYGAITDSAAGGTALSTGYKTSGGTVAMSPDDSQEYQTVLELANSLGKRTGVVASTDLCDATPASFTAHATHRSEKAEITGQQLQKLADGKLDLLIGPGFRYAITSAAADGRNAAKAAGVTIADGWEEVLEAKIPFAGHVKDEGDLLHGEKYPTLAEMTDLAINHLDGDENGFFLMVEGSCIDHASHNNAFDKMVKELTEFDKAVAVAMHYVATHPDTILIITADHETGGIELPEGFDSSKLGEAKYTSDNHTGVDVPVFAIGYGTEALQGENINTDIAKFIAKSMGVEGFGSQE